MNDDLHDGDEMHWAKVMQMDWPHSTMTRTNQDLSETMAEMRSRMGRGMATGKELLAAVRWLSGPEGKQKHPPTLQDLVRTVYTLRKESRNDQLEPGETYFCTACRNTGWVYLPAPPRYPNGASMPCLCAIGERQGKVDYQQGYQRDAMAAIVRAAYGDRLAHAGQKSPQTMIRMGTPAERWDLCCDLGRDESECMRYFAYARTLPGGYQRPRFAPFAPVAAGVQAGWRDAGGGNRAVEVGNA